MSACCPRNDPPRAVIDTNVYLSRLLRPTSVPGRAVAKAWTTAQPLISLAVWRELHDVLQRPTFAPYVQPAAARSFLVKVILISEAIEIPSPIRACRDPRDDKFLELAVHGRAGILITGDADLLALHPFQGVDILSPADFLSH